MIRPATEADIAGILAIWNPVIRDTTITFNGVEKTAADLAAMLADKARDGQAFLVAGEPGVVTGFATYGGFRGAGYGHTAEHSILVAPAAHGQGTGRALMDAIAGHARAAGVHSLIAGISGENAEGLAFHAAIGFARVGHLPAVGRKFGRWIDLILMQKFL